MIISVALLVAAAVSARAADAKENWDKNCKVCHGADGKGKTKMGEKAGVKDYTDPKVQEGMKDEEMTKAIKEGVKDGGKIMAAHSCREPFHTYINFSLRQSLGRVGLSNALHAPALNGVTVQFDVFNLANLLNNAAKYSDPCGRISVTAARQGDTAVVRVRDTGAGIPPELQPHVFDLFVQGERPIDRSQGGLGIGLTMVDHIVRAHGGRVTLASEPGRGSTFFVHLPVEDEGNG